MKYIRIILGVLMLFFGLNRMFHFMPEPPWPESAEHFLNALTSTGYMVKLITLVDSLVGALLLVNVLVPLALLMAISILVNSVLFHIFLAPELGLFAYAGGVISLILLYHYRYSFAPLLGKNLPIQASNRQRK